MTPTLKTKLEAILAECDRALKLAEQATPGEWREGTCNVWQDDLLICVAEMRHRHDYADSTRYQISPKDNFAWEQNDSRFIAASRTLTPQLARGLKIAIEALMDANKRMQYPFTEAALQRIADEFGEGGE